MSRLSIAALYARQILDSRGRPTVEVDATLADGSRGRASVPSGASTGAAEAHELRDGDKTQYAGFGVLRAVANVNGEIGTALRGADASDQCDIDARLRALDGTRQLTRLGANATLGVSLAVCRAVASARGQALYERIGELTGVQPLLPLPMTNILSGGLHAGGGMDVQDFLAVPMRASTIGEAIHVNARVRSAATDVMRDRGLPTLLADEGGLSPRCDRVGAALQLMVESIERAGLSPGNDVSIAIDVAASSLQRAGGRYAFEREGVVRDADAMIDEMSRWLREAPIVSIEDGLGEEDWDGWRNLTSALGSTLQLVGDDLFTTHPERLARGISERIANGVLVKANQNGTLSGALDVIAQAKTAGYATIVSARSGETEDPFIADLAVGTAAGQIKIGSLRTSSTVAKYNELIRIDERASARYAGSAALASRRS